LALSRRVGVGMKVGDLVMVDRAGGEPRRQLGIIISFAALEKYQGYHVMLINDSKKWFPTERLQVVNESR